MMLRATLVVAVSIELTRYKSYHDQAEVIDIFRKVEARESKLDAKVEELGACTNTIAHKVRMVVVVGDAVGQLRREGNEHTASIRSTVSKFEDVEVRG